MRSVVCSIPYKIEHNPRSCGDIYAVSPTLLGVDMDEKVGNTAPGIEAAI